jgi:F-type H+-transporting ATPase subunit b
MLPAFMMEAEFWVLVAFVVAIFFLVYKAKGIVTGGLDSRAAKIKAELDEAQRLRDEAQAKLAEFQRRQRDALKEAEGIVAQAKAEAQRLAAQGAKDIEAAIERRRHQAVEKIALEEQKAMADLRNTAVDLAVAALRHVLAEDLDAARQSALIDQAIESIPPTLH